MENPPYFLCSISFEDQSLDENRNSVILVNESTDYELKNELKIVESTRIKSWNHSSDPLPVQNAVENLAKFFSKTVAKDKFYFAFAEVEGKCDGEKNNSESDITVKHERTSTSSVEDASVFGSPLKLETIADMSINETASDCLSTTSVSDQNFTRLTGLPMNEARKLLGTFCGIKNIEYKESLLKTIVILCCRSEMDLSRDKIVLLGAHHDISGEMNKLKTFKVTCSNKKHSLSFLDPLDLQDGSVCSLGCSYNLLEQSERNRRLRMEAHWSNCHSNSIISNLHTARFSLHITASFGYGESPLLKQLRQLKYVMMLCKGLDEEELPSVLSTRPWNAQEKLQDLFVRIKNGMQPNKTSPVSGGGRGKKINLASSYSVDITDELWEIFAQSETCEDMVDCLKSAVNILKKNEFPLFVRSDNETMLAKLIRQFSSGMIYFPPLTNLMAIKIVAELGLEKMKKVYTSILLQNDLCSSTDIDDFLRDCSKEDKMRDVLPDHQINQTLVETVKKFHHCIDIVSLVDLRTGNLNLTTIVSHILNHYRLNGLDDNHTFVIPLDTRQASQEVETVLPCMVRREYKTGGIGRVECYLSEMPEGLAIKSPHAHSDTNTSNGGNVSVNGGGGDPIGKDCYKFKTEENVMILSSIPGAA